MSSADYLDVFGADSPGALAAEIAVALELASVFAGRSSRGEQWSIHGSAFRVDVHETLGELLPGEASIFAVITHQSEQAMHELSARIFEHLETRTNWGLVLQSEFDDDYWRARPMLNSSGAE